MKIKDWLKKMDGSILFWELVLLVAATWLYVGALFVLISLGRIIALIEGIGPMINELVGGYINAWYDFYSEYWLSPIKYYFAGIVAGLIFMVLAGYKIRRLGEVMKENKTYKIVIAVLFLVIVPLCLIVGAYDKQNEDLWKVVKYYNVLELKQNKIFRECLSKVPNLEFRNVFIGSRKVNGHLVPIYYTLHDSFRSKWSWARLEDIPRVESHYYYDYGTREYYQSLENKK